MHKHAISIVKHGANNGLNVTITCWNYGSNTPITSWNYGHVRNTVDTGVEHDDANRALNHPKAAVQTPPSESHPN